MTSLNQTVHNKFNEQAQTQNHITKNQVKVSVLKTIQYNIKINKQIMTFRLRPSSKKSIDTEGSLVQFPKPQQAFISNEVMSLKQLINKVQMLDSTINIMNEGIRRQRQISSAGYIQVQKRLDVMEYKSFANEKDIQQLSDINRSNYNPLPPLKRDPNQLLGKNQLAILKQTLLQERQSQKQHTKYMSQAVQQLSLKQLRLQQELRQMFNKTRTQHEQRMIAQTSQIQKVDLYKMRKIDNQHQLMKEGMQAMERRIVEQLQSKIRKQTAIKEYIHDQISLSKQQLLQEQKHLVSAEVKLTREMKQSLESLYSMITQLKTTFSEQLTQTQQLATNNIKRLAMNLDVIDGKYQQRMRTVQQQSKQSQQQMVNFRQWVVGKLDQNRQIVMGLQEQVIERMDGSQRKINNDGFTSQSSAKLQQRFNHLHKDLTGWKSLMQQKNLSIFKEISQSLKHMKLDYKKQNDQFSSQLISLTEGLKQIKKTLPSDMKKISQTIVTIFNDQFDVLAQQLDLVTEMIKVSKEEGQKLTRDQIKKHKEQFIQEIKSLIQVSIKKMNLTFQKSLIKTQQSLKTSLQKQSAYIQSLFNQRLERLETSTQEMQAQSKKINNNTTTQLENFATSMKQFNENYKQYLEEQRKQDLKKRIDLQDNMRKNASNLMDVAYKKSQFLVEGMKKAIQMNEMKKDLQTKQSLQSIKDEVARSRQHQKEELFTQMKTLQQKLSAERQNSEQKLQQTLNQSLDTLKRSLNIQLGNNKLQMEQKIDGFVSEMQQKLRRQSQKNSKTQQKIGGFVQQMQQKMRKQSEKNLKIQQKVESIKNQLSEQLKKTKMAQQQQINKAMKQLQSKLQNTEKRIGEETKRETSSIIQRQNSLQIKISEFDKSFKLLRQQIQAQKMKQKQNSQVELQKLQEQLKQQIENQFAQSAQKSQQSLKQYQQTLNALRQTLWKLQAMNFSQQAKNKAILDKINEDISQVIVNLDNVSKQIKAQQKGKGE